ncbi:dehydrogenase/reductase SDR family [Pimephales promelas]|nr:dehydrogenase/reductase SDR family [Pimephales promelas]
MTELYFLPDWCYQSQVTCNNTCVGPDKWATVAKNCGNRKQSPINIVTKNTSADSHLTPVQFTGYQEIISGVLTNNGHTVQLNLPNGAKINGANLGSTYKAQQLHLHWGKNGGPGSEHTIDGEKYPMELHIVHIRDNYTSVEQAIGDPSGVAVLGFFYEESDNANNKYEAIINSLKNITHPGTNVTLGYVSLDMLILPHDELEKYYRYEGSLTTPGCSEAVVWTIFEKTIPLSKEQLSVFSNLMFSDGTAMVNTYRPVQLRYGRKSAAQHLIFLRVTCNMDRWKGRVALVTGASVGIGAAIAKSLVQQGMKVVGCARNLEQIQNLAAECVSSGFSGTLFPYKCDLSVEEEVLSMFSWIKVQHQGIDVCINNAGLALPEPLLSGKTSGWRTMMDVNVIGLSVCTREAYQSMKERNIDDGHIININSMSGHRVVNNADSHFYSASKYAVTALTEGLRQELREAKTHIRATCISPGLVETEFAYRLFSETPEKAVAMYTNIKCLEAADITNAVLYVLSAPPHVQIGDIDIRPVEQTM